MLYALDRPEESVRLKESDKPDESVELNKSDEPEKSEKKEEPSNEQNGNSPISLGIIIAISILGAIVLVAIIFFLYRCINKKRKLNNESEIYKESAGEVMLKSEIDNN